MNAVNEKIIAFRISGKFAHFRKFYTNASSLSYLVPPRTAIMGMIASVLEYNRDTYYSLFDENKIDISVSIPENLNIRKQTQTLNYKHKEYYELLIGKIKDNKKSNEHQLDQAGKEEKTKNCVKSFQCKLELLMYPIDGEITYDIFLKAQEDNNVLNDFEQNLKVKSYGYGLYLGQRQFKAYAELIKINDFSYKGESDCLNSVCNEKNFTSVDLTDNIELICEQMPCHFNQIVIKENVISREPSLLKKIYFERNGKPLKGKFLNCYNVNDKVISFY